MTATLLSTLTKMAAIETSELVSTNAAFTSNAIVPSTRIAGAYPQMLHIPDRWQYAWDTVSGTPAVSTTSAPLQSRYYKIIMRLLVGSLADIEERAGYLFSEAVAWIDAVPTAYAKHAMLDSTVTKLDLASADSNTQQGMGELQTFRFMGEDHLCLAWDAWVRIEAAVIIHP